MITTSLGQAQQDVRRSATQPERESIAAVKNATLELLKSLQDAQFLGEHAPLCHRAGDGAFLAWTDDSANALGSSAWGFPVLSLPLILRALQSECASVLDRPPVNSILRQGPDAERQLARAFARRLAHRFRDDFNKEMVADVTRIVNAVLALSDPFSDRDVEKILEDSPLKKEKAQS